MKEEEILGILPLHIRTIIKQAGINWDELQEIRLRIQKPVILKYNAKTCYLSEQGKITTRKEQLHIVTSQEIRQVIYEPKFYEILKNMGETIGYLDQQMQEKTILLTIEQLDDQIFLMKDQVVKNCKMYRSLGISLSVLIVIILL